MAKKRKSKKKGGSKTCQKVSRHTRAGKKVKSYGRKRKTKKEIIMKFNFINAWKSGAKQDDKFCLKFRLGILTIIEVSSDFSDKYLRLIVCNIGMEINK